MPARVWTERPPSIVEQAALPPLSQAMQRHAQLSTLQSAYGNQAVLRVMKSQSERPRDKAASCPAQGGLLQRKCASCSANMSGGSECAECDKKRASAQRSSTSQAAPGNAPSVVHEVINSPGQPLDSETRALMESRFERQSDHEHSYLPATGIAHNRLTLSQPGDQYEQEADRVADKIVRTPKPVPQGETVQPRSRYDFSSVRVHTDAKAAESAREVDALAYTVNREIVFGQGQYAPHTDRGQRLLAHELTHTIQQTSRSGDNNHAVQRQWAEPWAEPYGETPADPANLGGAIPATTSADGCSASASLPISSTTIGVPTRSEVASNSFRGAAGASISISASATYDTPPGPWVGNEDYSVQLWQCHTVWDEGVGEKERANIGSSLQFNRTLPEAGWFSNDIFYLLFKNGSSNSNITITFSVT